MTSEYERLVAQNRAHGVGAQPMEPINATKAKLLAETNRRPLRRQTAEQGDTSNAMLWASIICGALFLGVSMLLFSQPNSHMCSRSCGHSHVAAAVLLIPGLCGVWFFVPALWQRASSNGHMGRLENQTTRGVRRRGQSRLTIRRDVLTNDRHGFKRAANLGLRANPALTRSMKA